MLELTVATSCWAKATSEARKASKGAAEAEAGGARAAHWGREGLSDCHSVSRGASWLAHLVRLYPRAKSYKARNSFSADMAGCNIKAMLGWPDCLHIWQSARGHQLSMAAGR